MIQLFGYKHMKSDYHYYSDWFHIIRPVTLTASIMPVTVGTLLAAQLTDLSITLYITLLITSVLIQAAVNMLNDYFDFMKGQEEGKWHDVSPSNSHFTPLYSQVPFVSLSIVAVVSLLTLWLASESSYWIIPLGISGFILGYHYSAGIHSLSSLGLGEIAGAICLGPLPFIIAILVHGAPFSWEMLLHSLPFAILMATMVLTNNIRDIKKDSSTRKTVAIRIGKKKAVYLLTGLLALTYISSLLIYASLWILLSLPLAVTLIHRFYQKEGANPMEIAAKHHMLHSTAIILSIIL